MAMDEASLRAMLRMVQAAVEMKGVSMSSSSSEGRPPLAIMPPPSTPQTRNRGADGRRESEAEVDAAKPLGAAAGAAEAADQSGAAAET